MLPFGLTVKMTGGGGDNGFCHLSKNSREEVKAGVGGAGQAPPGPAVSHLSQEAEPALLSRQWPLGASLLPQGAWTGFPAGL